MADNFLFFTELMAMPVFDVRGRRIGKVKDAALVPLVHSSRIDRFLMGGGEAWLVIRFDQVRTIELGRGISLTDEKLVPYHDDEYMLRIARDLLDQQIIDAQGRKVVRINDLTLELRQDDGVEQLWVLEVDIGIRSIFRRVLQGLPPRWCHWSTRSASIAT